MGSSVSTTKPSKCTRSLLLLPLWLLPTPPLLQPMAPLPQLSTRRPLSHLPMNIVCLMTTPRTTSGRLRPRTPMVLSRDLSPLLSLMAESRPPSTLLMATMDLLLRSPMRVPQSTPLSPRRDMAMLPLSLPTNLLLLLPLPLATMLNFPFKSWKCLIDYLLNYLFEL